MKTYQVADDQLMYTRLHILLDPPLDKYVLSYLTTVIHLTHVKTGRREVVEGIYS